MDPSARLTRRQILAGMGILVFAAVPGVLRSRESSGAGLDVTTAVERVAALVDDVPAVAELGGAYLAARPDDPDAEQLFAELLPTRMTDRDVQQSSREQLRTVLHEAVVADFSAGRTVTVQGWLLSATEARLAGLVRTLRP